MYATVVNITLACTSVLAFASKSNLTTVVWPLLQAINRAVTLCCNSKHMHVLKQELSCA